MLLSQPFHDVSKNHEKFHQSAKDSTPLNPTPQSYSKPLMSVSSLSSSSSPSSDVTPPGSKKNCSGLEVCENGSFSKAENQSFPIEQLFGKVEETESRPPRSDSCPNGLFTETAHSENNVKSQNDSAYCYSPTDAYSKLYDTAGPFESQSNACLALHTHSYTRTNSQDLSANGDQALLQHPSSASRKSFDNITDKELRKKLKNRESAQAARDRKKAKMLSLERQVNELHERYRMVESENQELKIRIQRMEASTYWIGKHDPNGVTPESSVMIPFPVGAVGPLPQGASTSNPNAYNRGGQYPSLCGFGDYAQHPQCVSTVSENGNTEPLNSMPIFSPMPHEAAEFHPSSYPSGIWSTEPLSTHPNPAQQGTFASDSNYSESGNFVG